MNQRDPQLCMKLNTGLFRPMHVMRTRGIQYAVHSRVKKSTRVLILPSF